MLATKPTIDINTIGTNTVVSKSVVSKSVVSESVVSKSLASKSLASKNLVSPQKNLKLIITTIIGLLIAGAILSQSASRLLLAATATTSTEPVVNWGAKLIPASQAQSLSVNRASLDFINRLNNTDPTKTSQTFTTLNAKW